MSASLMSQDHSPAAMFQESPSPSNAAGPFSGGRGLTNMNMITTWQPPMTGLQTNGSAPTIRQDPMGVTSPAYNIPPYALLRYNQGLPPPRLVVHPTPLKSRVETQIPIKLTIHHLPPGIKKIHLPTHTISKPKLLAKPAVGRSPDMLELHTMLVCTSAMEDSEKMSRAFKRAAAARHDFSSPKRVDDNGDDEENKPQNGGEVRICNGCITRERKRAGRKKHKKPEEEELWNRYEHQRVIVFNTQEVKEWQVVTPLMADPIQAGPRDLSVPDGTVQVDVPMRIACYCRHHGEKQGFKVIFTMKDWKDNVVAQQISSSIMITDDHKTHLPTTSTAHSSASIPAIGAVPADGMNGIKALETSLASDIQGLTQNGTYTFPPTPINTNPQAMSVPSPSRNISRQASPTSPSGPLSRKRKASGTIKVPPGLAMTRLENVQPQQMTPAGTQSESAINSTATSPFSPNMTTFPMAGEPLFTHGQQPSFNNNIGRHFPTGPPTPNSNNADQFIFPSGNRNMSLDTAQITQMFSAPTSTHPSRAPSPNRLRNDAQSMQQAPQGQNMFNNVNAAMNSNMAPQPTIYKVIPHEGPKSGNIEVTILGTGFTDNGLAVYFGDQKAATTTYWGETSLVCLLPPSASPGHVPVSIRQPNVPPQQAFNSNTQLKLFRYVDDDETHLIRTALTVLGNKLGGKMSDVTDIARSILYSGHKLGGGGSWSPSAGGSQGFNSNSNFNALEKDLPESVETGLLRILRLIDMDDSPNKARLDLRRSSGQTMLHLACSLGFVRFAAGLLARGANVGMRDKGGFTPLHMAAMNDRPEIVRLLIRKGADPYMRTLSGLTAAEVTRTSDVLRVLRVENHSRSRSNGSIPSRANSATSLTSLWEPRAATPQYGEEFMSDSLSSADDSDSEDDSSDEINSENEGGDWLDMRRPSFPSTRRCQDIPPRQSTDEADAPPSPGQSVAALREHITAQFHHMAMQLQNLPQLQMPHMQMPQMPTFPPMLLLPDYQNYLKYAPPDFLQYLNSFIPNIRGPHPGPADGQSAVGQPPRDGDNKWFDIPFFGNKDSPPPAYNDIFPGKDLGRELDIKRGSMMAAAAEFAADEKCAATFDQSTSEEVVASSSSQEVPTLLEIGRKCNITKEQQEHLQRAHAQRLKTGSSDKMLWFVWVSNLESWSRDIHTNRFNRSPFWYSSLALCCSAVLLRWCPVLSHFSRLRVPLSQIHGRSPSGSTQMLWLPKSYFFSYITIPLFTTRPSTAVFLSLCKYLVQAFLQS